MALPGSPCSDRVLLKFSSVKSGGFAAESRRQAGFTETFFSKIEQLRREALAVVGFC